jgi:hypothetical protein
VKKDKWRMAKPMRSQIYEWKEVQRATLQDVKFEIAVCELNGFGKTFLRETCSKTPLEKVYDQNYQLFFRVESASKQETDKWKDWLEAWFQLDTHTSVMDHTDHQLIVGMNDMGETFRFIESIKDKINKIEEWPS